MLATPPQTVVAVPKCMMGALRYAWCRSSENDPELEQLMFLHHSGGQQTRAGFTCSRCVRSCPGAMVQLTLASVHTNPEASWC